MKIEPEAIIAIITALVGGIVRIIQLTKKNRRTNEQLQSEQKRSANLLWDNQRNKVHKS